MLSFWILPSKEGHGHYLNWGLTISVALLAVSELRERERREPKTEWEAEWC